MAKGVVRIAEGAIKITVPEVIQHTSYSCGASSLHAICCYWGVGLRCDLDYIPHLESDNKAGTTPQNITYFARSAGLRVKEIHDMEIADLKELLDQGKPVICCIQAWGDSKKYKKKNYSGHYITAIGYDKKHIFFEDSSLPGVRGYLTYKQFEDRWHDEDIYGNIYNHYGIAIWKNTKPGYLYRAKKVK